MSAAEWHSAAELAEFRLPGLPASKRGVSRVARERGWRDLPSTLDGPGWRERQGRGGGVEYHLSVLPRAARVALCRELGITDPVCATVEAETDASRSLIQATDKDREVALFRAEVLMAVRDRRGEGMRRSDAVGAAAQQYAGGEHPVSASTINRWLRSVSGYPSTEWARLLLPVRRSGRPRQGVPDEALEFLRGDYGRAERPSLTSCIARLRDVAAERGWELPSDATLQRRFNATTDARVMRKRRYGGDVTDAMFAPQKRSTADFHALQAVNADGHIWDVFVQGEGGKPYRPIMVAVQDLYSKKILSHRIGRTLDAELVRLAFGDVFREYGIPERTWLDNGREFAAKAISGGTPTRFRFKVTDTEPLGVLPLLGVQIDWARPYRGQSKPIERAFRDMCDRIAKDPRFHGAWAGNMPGNKPHNYGSRAVPLDQFKTVVAEGINAHNARRGRRSGACAGRSFDETFAESYAVSPIRRARPEDLRLCLKAAVNRKADPRSGMLTLFNNTYWTEALSAHAGELLQVRYDPDRLHDGVDVYDTTGAFLFEAECWHAAGFADQKAARDHANRKKRFQAKLRELEAEQVPHSVRDVAAMLPVPKPPSPDAAEPTVIVPAFGAGGFGGAAAARKADPRPDFVVPTPERDTEPAPVFDFEAAGRNIHRLRRSDD